MILPKGVVPKSKNFLSKCNVGHMTHPLICNETISRLSLTMKSTRSKNSPLRSEVNDKLNDLQFPCLITSDDGSTLIVPPKWVRFGLYIRVPSMRPLLAATIWGINRSSDGGGRIDQRGKPPPPLKLVGGTMRFNKVEEPRWIFVYLVIICGIHVYLIHVDRDYAQTENWSFAHPT